MRIAQWQAPTQGRAHKHDAKPDIEGLKELDGLDNKLRLQLQLLACHTNSNEGSLLKTSQQLEVAMWLATVALAFSPTQPPHTHTHTHKHTAHDYWLFFG